MAVGKIVNRGLSLDSNPTEIGWAVVEKDDNDGIKILDSGCYKLDKLCKKLNLSANHPLQIEQNNKRRTELYNTLTKIFEIAAHYNVFNIIVEELNFNSKPGETKNREANRKINNLWYRKIITDFVTKQSKLCGYKLIEVNPVYTSFLGAILYPNIYDPIAASMVIGWRGLYKYDKGKFLPTIKDSDLHTLESMFKTRLKLIELLTI